MQYKCVPGPWELVIERKENAIEAVRSYANIINREAVDGWVFHSIERISVTQTPGCIDGFFGKKSETTDFYMLIFCNENLSAPTGNARVVTQSENIGTQAKCKNCSKKSICEELFKDTEMAFDENSCCEEHEF